MAQSAAQQKPQPAPPARHEGASRDPQADKAKAPPAPEVYDPKPSLDPRAEAPKDAYVDGMDVASEQRARSAWIEGHGMAKYHEATDEKTEQKQVPGVTPPTKRE